MFGLLGLVEAAAGNGAICWHREDEVLNQAVSQLANTLLMPRVNIRALK